MLRGAHKQTWLELGQAAGDAGRRRADRIAIWHHRPKGQRCESKDRTIGGIAGSLSTFRFPELGALGVVDI